MSSIKTCPSCRGQYKGAYGLSIHLSKSKACAQSRDYETLHRLTDQPLINAASVFGSADVEALDTNYARNIDEGNNFDESQEHPFHRSSNYFHTNNLSSPNLSEEKSETKKSFNSTMELIYLIYTCNNGDGLSKSDQDKWLALLTDPRFDCSDIGFTSAAGLEKFMDKFDSATFGDEVS